MADEIRSSESDSEEDERRLAGIKRKLESLQKLAGDYETEQPQKSKQMKLNDFFEIPGKGTAASSSARGTINNFWTDPDPLLHVYASAGLKNSTKVKKM